MKNKPADTLYCGVREHEIASLCLESVNPKVLDEFLYFIKERYKIHLRKDVYKKPKPWTQDPILQKYRFTNVRREHDRNTRWLIQNISKNPSLNKREKVLNSILFRLFNKIETAEMIGIPIKLSDIKNLDTDKYAKLFLDNERQIKCFFTGAYMSSGMLREFHKLTGDYYSPISVMKIVQSMGQNHFPRRIWESGSPQEITELLMSYNGISQFTAYQLFVDLTYIEDFPFSENEFTLAGPGATYGLKYLFKERNNLTSEEQIFWLRDNWKALNQYSVQHGGKNVLNPQKIFVDLPLYDRVMNVMSIENCLCEFSKYMKTLLGTGRPRKKYVPHK